VPASGCDLIAGDLEHICGSRNDRLDPDAMNSYFVPQVFNASRLVVDSSLDASLELIVASSERHPNPSIFSRPCRYELPVGKDPTATTPLVELPQGPSNVEPFGCYLVAGGRQVIAPRVLFRQGDQPGAHGVENDVSRYREQVRVLLDEAPSESSLKQVTHPGVPPIESLRISSVELPHPA